MMGDSKERRGSPGLGMGQTVLDVAVNADRIAKMHQHHARMPAADDDGLLRHLKGLPDRDIDADQRFALAAPDRRRTA